MMKTLLIIIMVLILAIVGSYIGNWNQFMLKGTGLELRGVNSDHQYIVDSKTGRVLVAQHVTDVGYENNYVFALREVATSYECYSSLGERLIFTHYEGSIEVVVIDLKTRNKSTFHSEVEFIRWVKEQGFSSSFIFNTAYSNDDAFNEMKKKRSCTTIE